MNGQKQKNDNISEKFLADDKILESLAMQLEGFNSVIKHQLSFNELIETKVTQLASSCLKHDTGKLSGQPEVTPKESLSVVAVRARQTAQKPHLLQDAGIPSCLNHDTGKLSGQPEVTPKESENVVVVRARQSAPKPHLPQDASTRWKTVTARNTYAEDGVLEEAKECNTIATQEDPVEPPRTSRDCHDTTALPFLERRRRPVADEQFDKFVEVTKKF